VYKVSSIPQEAGHLYNEQHECCLGGWTTIQSSQRRRPSRVASLNVLRVGCYVLYQSPVVTCSEASHKHRKTALGIRTQFAMRSPYPLLTTTVIRTTTATADLFTLTKRNCGPRKVRGFSRLTQESFDSQVVVWLTMSAIRRPMIGIRHKEFSIDLLVIFGRLPFIFLL
jgi:hypothetical protein